MNQHDSISRPTLCSPAYTPLSASVTRSPATTRLFTAAHLAIEVWARSPFAHSTAVIAETVISTYPVLLRPRFRLANDSGFSLCRSPVQFAEEQEPAMCRLFVSALEFHCGKQIPSMGVFEKDGQLSFKW